jgi:hypothetical protein
MQVDPHHKTILKWIILDLSSNQAQGGVIRSRKRVKRHSSQPSGDISRWNAPETFADPFYRQGASLKSAWKRRHLPGRSPIILRNTLLR